jgi:hypothetical protein
MPIKNGSSVDGRSGGLHRRIMKSGRLLAVSVSCALAVCAWSQTAPLTAPDLTDSFSWSGGPATNAVPDASTFGSIHGVVTNRDGLVYEGAHVDLATNATPLSSTLTTTSDSNGRFNFGSVAPGPFQLTVSSNGFSTQVVSGILHPSESYEARAIVLPFTAASSDVVVTASSEQIAQEQMIEEEKQRVLGIIPNFYVAYAPNAAPLNARQKFDLAWKTSIDPITILTAAASAGIEQADNGLRGYGQGAEGYADRFGANYGNIFIGTMLGSAVLPVMLKQDPRYFYKGTGTVRSRALYAIANAVICKGDNGRWQPNYSGIIGGLAAGGISNLYYPASSRDGATLTFENAGLGIAGGAVQNLFQEFVIRRLTPKLPHYGTSGQ